MKIWIYRTEADIPSDVYESVIWRHPEDAIHYTKLIVFYDKPQTKNPLASRTMCEVPNYMYPEIKEGECCEFETCHWKPSEEQMEALDFAVDCVVPPEFCYKRSALKSLLRDLGKLFEK